MTRGWFAVQPQPLQQWRDWRAVQPCRRRSARPTPAPPDVESSLPAGGPAALHRQVPQPSTPAGWPFRNQVPRTSASPG